MSLNYARLVRRGGDRYTGVCSQWNSKLVLRKRKQNIYNVLALVLALSQLLKQPPGPRRFQFYTQPPALF